MPQDHAFTYRLEPPDDPDGTTLVLLHGSGGDETQIMALGRQMAPRAQLLGLRGRSLEEGFPRWFRRLSMTVFDQAQIRAEANAFARFLPELLAAEAIDPEGVTFAGYSNGGNFIGALLLLHPDLVRRAILMRCMPALEEPPATDLAGRNILMITGDQDGYGPFAPALETQLRQRGAQVSAHLIAAGHELRDTDSDLARAWLAERTAVAIS